MSGMTVDMAVLETFQYFVVFFLIERILSTILALILGWFHLAGMTYGVGLFSAYKTVISFLTAKRDVKINQGFLMNIRRNLFFMALALVTPLMIAYLQSNFHNMIRHDVVLNRQSADFVSFKGKCDQLADKLVDPSRLVCDSATEDLDVWKTVSNARVVSAHNLTDMISIIEKEIEARRETVDEYAAAEYLYGRDKINYINSSSNYRKVVSSGGIAPAFGTVSNESFCLSHLYTKWNPDICFSVEGIFPLAFSNNYSSLPERTVYAVGGDDKMDPVYTATKYAVREVDSNLSYLNELMTGAGKWQTVADNHSGEVELAFSYDNQTAAGIVEFTTGVRPIYFYFSSEYSLDLYTIPVESIRLANQSGYNALSLNFTRDLTSFHATGVTFTETGMKYGDLLNVSLVQSALYVNTYVFSEAKRLPFSSRSYQPKFKSVFLDDYHVLKAFNYGKKLTVISVSRPSDMWWAIGALTFVLLILVICQTLLVTGPDIGHLIGSNVSMCCHTYRWLSTLVPYYIAVSDRHVIITQEETKVTLDEGPYYGTAATLNRLAKIVESGRHHIRTSLSKQEELVSAANEKLNQHMRALKAYTGCQLKHKTTKEVRDLINSLEGENVGSWLSSLIPDIPEWVTLDDLDRDTLLSVAVQSKMKHGIHQLSSLRTTIEAELREKLSVLARECSTLQRQVDEKQNQLLALLNDNHGDTRVLRLRRAKIYRHARSDLSQDSNSDLDSEETRCTDEKRLHTAEDVVEELGLEGLEDASTLEFSNTSKVSVSLTIHGWLDTG